jgi:acyl-CoA thioesterase YciA
MKKTTRKTAGKTIGKTTEKRTKKNNANGARNVVVTKVSIRSEKPQGELVLQNVAMPADVNAYGDIFGGWLVSQMDLGGAVLAHQRARNRVTTVAINSMAFIQPVLVGDLVCCYAKEIKTGRSSITIKVQVWVKRMRVGELYVKVTEGLFTYVALDEQRRPKAIKW